MYLAALSEPENMALSPWLGRCYSHAGVLAWFRVSFRGLILLPLSEITRLLDDLLLYCRSVFSIRGGTSVADET